MTENNSKFDLQGLVGSIKSMINPAGNTPNPNPEDGIGIKIAELSVKVQELQTAYKEQGKALQAVNTLANEIFTHLEEFRQKEQAAKEQPEESAEKAAEPEASSDKS